MPLVTRKLSISRFGEDDYEELEFFCGQRKMIRETCFEYFRV